MDGQEIDEIINLIFPTIKDTVMFIKGGYDLKRCIETLEDYMKASGMNSDHRVNGNIHTFLIQHDLGTKWSVFTEQLLKQVFRSFLPDKELNFQTTDSTVILKVSLPIIIKIHFFRTTVCIVTFALNYMATPIKVLILIFSYFFYKVITIPRIIR